MKDHPKWAEACEVAEQVWLSGDERSDARLKFRDAIEAAFEALFYPGSPASIRCGDLHWDEPDGDDRPNNCRLFAAKEP